MGTAKATEHVVVVGAGMVGLSTAWHLLDRGVKVTVVDKKGVAAGSSWGNAGWLTPALTLPLSEPAVLAYGLKAMLDPSSPLYIPLSADPQLWRFLVGFARHCTPGKWREAMEVFTEVNRLGLDAFDELAEAGGTSGNSGRRNSSAVIGGSGGDGGTATLTADDAAATVTADHAATLTADGAVSEPTKVADPFLAGFASFKDRDALVHEFDGVVRAGGVVDYDLVDGDDLRALEPTLGAGVKAGVQIRGQRFINPPRFMESLADAVRARGGEIVDGFDVVDIRDDGTRVRVIGADGRMHAADDVVIASGAWLGKLARNFGIKRVVQAGRGYSFTVVPEVMPTHPIYFPAQRVACTPLGDRFRVAGMMEFRSADAPLDPRRIQAIIGAARPMFTGIDWTDRKEEWVGSRPCTTDGLPLIGATRSRRVHVAGGHGMWGIALGPLTGKMLAASITGDTTPAIMRRFNPLR
ncbi:oxidoreductase [Arthrobacter crystallopoietes BAB-32]|uniref:Oxidoreductase n=1 Tax=Arthrobacter crystallopoietes BAB-32 TaxID=1246476 RepID=N1V2F0_9MICC|nr:FAD-dependent oxidoreductase [Arthrobacter crystallopoietes]EMY34242.1 oxidoreductase [Arthrobacter crystallopoietes BAB-32]